MDIIKDMNTDTKKTEKLASAVYLLTSFFDDKEPMKWRLRELSAKLVSTRSDQMVVSDIISLLNVSHNAGLISDTNFEIVHREFEKLAPKGQLVSEFLKQIETNESVNLPAPVEKALEQAEKPAYTPRPQLTPIKDRAPREHAPYAASEQKKNNRQDAILDLLKKKKEIMIRDVAPVIKGVSEKTIQRELLAMVSKGILKKEGEKRWSRYTLA